MTMRISAIVTPYKRRTPIAPSALSRARTHSYTRRVIRVECALVARRRAIERARVGRNRLVAAASRLNGDPESVTRVAPPLTTAAAPAAPRYAIVVSGRFFVGSALLARRASSS